MRLGPRLSAVIAIAALAAAPLLAQRAGARPDEFTRPPAPAAEIARGQQIFSANCSFCHGDDARGGSTGPNLVRAKIVLDDQNGEQIAPVVHGSLSAQGMPSFELGTSDIQAIAAWLHDQQLGNRGAPTTLDILVGNAAAGKTYFNGAGKCATCHSVTGDLAGIGAKVEPKVLQNLIVSGLPGGRGAAAPPTTVTVTLPSGEAVTGKLDHLDAFLVALTTAGGVYRTFVLNGDSPKVAVHDPRQPHLDMLLSWKDTDLHNVTAYLATLK